MNLRNIRNFIRDLAFDRPPAGKVPIKIQEPKSSEETRLLGRANELMDRAVFTAEEMKKLDNQPADSNPELGKVAVDGERLGRKNSNQSGVLEYDLESGEIQRMDVESIKRIDVELSRDRNYDRILLSKTSVERDGHLVRYEVSDKVNDVLNRDYDILVNTRDGTLVFEHNKVDHVWVGTEQTYGLS